MYFYLKKGLLFHIFTIRTKQKFTLADYSNYIIYIKKQINVFNKKKKELSDCLEEDTKKEKELLNYINILKSELNVSKAYILTDSKLDNSKIQNQIKRRLRKALKYLSSIKSIETDFDSQLKIYTDLINIHFLTEKKCYKIAKLTISNVKRTLENYQLSKIDSSDKEIEIDFKKAKEYFLSLLQEFENLCNLHSFIQISSEHQNPKEFTEEKNKTENFHSIDINKENISKDNNLNNNNKNININNEKEENIKFSNLIHLLYEIKNLTEIKELKLKNKFPPNKEFEILEEKYFKVKNALNSLSKDFEREIISFEIYNIELRILKNYIENQNYSLEILREKNFDFELKNLKSFSNGFDKLLEFYGKIKETILKMKNDFGENFLYNNNNNINNNFIENEKIKKFSLQNTIFNLMENKNEKNLSKELKNHFKGFSQNDLKNKKIDEKDFFTLENINQKIKICAITKTFYQIEILINKKNYLNAYKEFEFLKEELENFFEISIENEFENQKDFNTNEIENKEKEKWELIERLKRVREKLLLGYAEGIISSVNDNNDEREIEFESSFSGGIKKLLKTIYPAPIYIKETEKEFEEKVMAGKKWYHFWKV